MNFELVVYILGWILDIEAAFMIMPCIVAVLSHESQGYAFLWVALACALVGTLAIIRKPKDTRLYVKEGFVIVALSWILMSVIGCLPFVLNGDIPDFIDALFETISGFTTTGASILDNVEGLAHCSLFWRSFTHWIGGMGVLVFLLAILPMAGGSTMNLMKAESPGPSVGKLVPKVKYTAVFLYGIYIVLTLIEIILLAAGEMSFFESVNISLATAGTGGFGVRNDSCGSYSAYSQWVITVFMILFGVNFNVYFLIIIKKFKAAFKFEEMRAYFAIIFASAVIIFINIYDMFDTVAEALRHIFFQIGAIITTTGFSSCDFDMWPQTSKTVLVILMFVGACAGSTGGGIKVSRLMIMLKTVYKEIISYLHPRSVRKVKMDDKVIEHEVIRATNVYFITYMLIFVASLLLISIENNPMVTNFTAVAAAFNNIGPGLEMVGPTRNFAFFSDFSKIVLMFDMLAGRLEIFPILLMLCPAVWRKKN